MNNRSTSTWSMSTIQWRICYERVTNVENAFLYTSSCHQLRVLFPQGQTNRRRQGYEFFTAAMRKTIPTLYVTEDVSCANKMLYVHSFLGSHDWYIAELEP